MQAVLLTERTRGGRMPSSSRAIARAEHRTGGRTGKAIAHQRRLLLGEERHRVGKREQELEQRQPQRRFVVRGGHEHRGNPALERTETGPRGPVEVGHEHRDVELLTRSRRASRRAPVTHGPCSRIHSSCSSNAIGSVPSVTLATTSPNRAGSRRRATGKRCTDTPSMRRSRARTRRPSRRSCEHTSVATCTSCSRAREPRRELAAQRLGCHPEHRGP